MTVDNFLTNLITNKQPYALTAEDKKTIQFEGIEKYIYKKLNNSKYKCTKTTDDYDKIVLEKIHYCVQNNLPIHLDLSTGATKNPNAVTAPGIDWAEVFNVALLRDYLKPIAAAYKNGVALDYFSVAMFEEKVNHIPERDSELYDKQFTELIKVYQNYLPENFTLRYSRLSDRCDKKAVDNAMDDLIAKLREAWPQLSEEVRQEKLMRAERNILFTGKETNRAEVILTAALAHDAFCGEGWCKGITPIWYEKDDISLGHRYTAGWAIHVRSAQASTINFWSGTGILMQKGDSYIPNILSPKQYKDVEAKLVGTKVEFFEANSVLSEKLGTVAVTSYD